MPLLREDLRAVLRALPDIGRALGRVVAGRGSPRDLGQLRDGLTEARRVHGSFADAARIAPHCWNSCCPRWAGTAR